MIWFLHSSGTETSSSSADRATANSAPVDISPAARRKIPSNRGFSISNLIGPESLRDADWIDGGFGDTRSVCGYLGGYAGEIPADDHIGP
jgi:hypothetical protein